MKIYVCLPQYRTLLRGTLSRPGRPLWKVDSHDGASAEKREVGYGCGGLMELGWEGGMTWEL